MTMNPRLGALVGEVEQVMAAAILFQDDPITIASGIGMELQPLVNRATMNGVEVLLRLHGYRTYGQFLAEVEDRTTEHWLAFNTFLLWYDEIAEGFFSREAYEPDLFDSMLHDTPGTFNAEVIPADEVDMPVLEFHNGVNVCPWCGEDTTDGGIEAHALECTVIQAEQHTGVKRVGRRVHVDEHGDNVTVVGRGLPGTRPVRQHRPTSDGRLREDER